MKDRWGAARLPRPFGFAFVLTVVVLAAALSGCLGGEESDDRPPGALAAALAYLSESAGAVVAIETDLDGEALRSLEALGSRVRGWSALKRELEAAVGRRGLDFEEVVRPQLGNPLVVGIEESGRRVGALRVRRPVELRRVAERRIRAGDAIRLGDHEGALLWREKGARGSALGFAALAERELVLAESEQDLKDAIDTARGSESLAFDRSFRSSLERLGDSALVRSVGDAQRLLENADPGEAAELRRIRWIRALGAFTAAARVEGRGLGIDLDLRTDRSRLSRADLPLGPGTAAPRLHDPGAAASLAVLEPERLVRFFERTLAVTDPARSARLRSGIEAVRSFFGVDAHKDLLAPITALSVAAVSATGTTFQATLRPGSAREFTSDLDRARPLVEGIAAELAPGSTVEARARGTARFWLVRNRGFTLARYAVRGGALVGAIGLARLPAPARGRRLPGARGSLAIKGDPRRLAPLADLLPGIPNEAVEVLSALGDFSLGVRAETSGLTGRGRVRIAR